jgi:alanine dehydrogenase
MLILSHQEIEGLVGLKAAIDAVERAFALDGRGLAMDGRRFHVAARNGSLFHVVAGGLLPDDGRALLSLKANGHIAQAGGGRRVTGAILLLDADSGSPLALLDSGVVTRLRTAAVTAVAARRLARRDARTALIVGAGRQARGQIDALTAVLRLDSIAIHARDARRAAELADYANGRGVTGVVAPDARRAARGSDVIVTITTADKPLLFDEDVPAGCFVAALGADAPGKQELDPILLGNAHVVVDRLAQAADAGELRNALLAGVMSQADIHAELGEIVAGKRPGRTDGDQRFVFDSTGTALQDVAAASVVVDAARRRGVGVEISLSPGPS